MNLDAQFQEAKEKYKELVQVDQFHYKIRFGESPMEFDIIFPADDPGAVPNVLCRGRHIKLPITDNWCRCFLLVHIIDQLEVYASVKTPNKFTVDEQEIERLVKLADRRTLMESEFRQRIINRLVDEPRYQVEKLESERAAARRRVQRNNDDIKTTLMEIEEMCVKRDELQGEIAINSDPSVVDREARRAKIDELYVESEKKRAEIEEIQTRFAKNKLSPEEYLKAMIKARSEQLFSEIMAEELEVELPR